MSESSAAPAFLDLSLGARKLRLERAKRRAERAWRVVGHKIPILRRQSSVIFLASQGQSRPNALAQIIPYAAASVSGLEPPFAYEVVYTTTDLVDCPDSRSPDQFRVPHITVTISQVHIS